MEEKPRTSTTGDIEGKKRLVVSVGGFSAVSGGGIVVAGVIFFGGIIVTASAAFSFLSRRRRDNSGNRDGRHSSTAVSMEGDEEEGEEDLKKFGFEQDMDQNLLRFDLIISSPLRLNHFGEIKETKLVTCIFRNGSSSYARADDYSDAVSADGFFRPPDKKGMIEFSCENDEEEEELPLLLPNVVQNSFDGDQGIKSLTIPLPNSENNELLFQAAPENPSIYHEEDEYAMCTAKIVEKEEELYQDGADTVEAQMVFELTETEEKLVSILEDHIGHDNGIKLADYDSDSIVTLTSEESQENGNQDQMLHENDPKPADLILASVNGRSDDEKVEEEKFVEMEQVMHLGKFNNDWISEKGLLSVIKMADKSSSSSSLIERYTLNLAKQSERTTNSHRRSVLVFTVLVLSGSLNVWYSSKPLLNLLLMHFRNYIIVKLHLLYRNHGRNHLRLRSVPKMLGI